MNKKVTLLIPTVRIGGAEKQLALLALELTKRNWQVTVFCFQKTGPLAKILVENNVAILDGGFRFEGMSILKKIALLIRSTFRLWKHLISNDVQIVHGFLPLPSYAAVFCGHLSLKKRIITSRRGLGTYRDEFPLACYLDRLTHRLSSAVTANSKAVALDIARNDQYPLEKINVIPNGVVLSELLDGTRIKMRANLGLRNNDIAIASVGNLQKHKGQLELLSALPQVIEQYPNVRLFLIGKDQGSMASLNQKIVDENLVSNVTLLGSRDDIPSLLTAMDFGVLPSHREGLPNALIEKLLAGLPVVASDVGGVSEVCEGIPGCTLVPSQDIPALTHALLDLCSSLPSQLSAARKRTEIIKDRYSVDTMIEAYEQLYGIGERPQNHV